MCRMMLVTGEFDVEEMLSAASDMARGAFSVADAPKRVAALASIMPVLLLVH